MHISLKSALLSAFLGVLVLANGNALRGAVVAVATPADLIPGSVPLLDPGINTLWDLNGDGTNDFNFTFRQPQVSGDVDWQANAFPLNGAKIIGTFDSSGDFFNPSNLTLGSTVSSANTFIGSVQGILGETYAGTSDGLFINTQGNLGFSLTVGANTYYGYVKLSVARSGGIDFISAAYDNANGTAITVVPEPGTWAMLAAGGLMGLVYVRVRIRRTPGKLA